ncbi:autotransporter domain-containing protein [Polaromonas sp. SP1]|nr:autotransporter domain-containing protein [Polaromonas sp. SP1]
MALQALFAFPAHAQFTVNPGVTDTAGKTLAGAAGVVLGGGTLTTSGATSAITVNAGTSTITNAGTISQTGTGRTIDANTGTPNLTITNNLGGLITAIGGEVIRVNRAPGSYIINNQGTIWQMSTTPGGSRAIKADAAFTSTNNQVINGSASNRAAIIRSDANDAIRLGSNFTLTNYGSIFSTGVVNTSCPDYLKTPVNLCAADLSAADGVAIENGRSNVVILNYGSITGPRHGVDGGDPVAAAADANLAGVDRLIVTATGPNGVTFDKVVGGVTTSGVKIVNPVVINFAGGTLTGNNGSGVGLDGHGVVINYGTITGKYAGAGKVYDHEGLGRTTSNGDGDGVDIDGIAYVENYGRIEGLGAGGFDSGGNPNGADGIAAGGGTIINHAGAVIFGQSKGILVDDGANGTAVAARRGTATATGGIAKIFNEGTITAEKGTAIGLVGNFNDSITNYATGVITGGKDSVRVDQNGSTTPAAAIQMGDGDDTLINYGRIEGKNGMAIDMGAGNDTTSLFGGVIIGTIDGGAGTDTLETGGTQTFAAGTVTGFENFTVRNGSTTFNYGLGPVANVQVDSGASLQVNGALALSGNLTVNGTFKASAGTELRPITVAGTFAQGATGVLETGLGAGNLADKISVTGAATIANGATIRPVPRGYVNNGAYTVMSAAGGLTATPASLVVANTALVNYTLGRTGNDLVVNAQRATTLGAVTPSGLGSMGAALEVLGQSGNAGAASVFAALDALPTTQAVGDALSQLAPDTSRTAQQASQLAAGTLFSALEGRMDSARSGPLAQAATGLSAGDGASRRSWVQGTGSQGTQDARAGAPAYKLHAYGVAAGLETDRSANEVMGMSLAYTQAGTDGKGNAQGDEVRVNAATLGGYFSQTNDGMTLDASVLLGYNSYKSERRVSFGGFTETAKGDYKGWQAGGRVEAGFPFAINPSWSGRWLVGGRVGYLATDGYTETGSAAAQRVGSSSATSLQSVLGTELTHTLADNSSLQLRARYLHEFSNSPDVKASFVAGGPGFTMAGTRPGRDALQLGIGWRKVTAQGVTISLRYDAEVKANYLAHQLSARAIWSF